MAVTTKNVFKLQVQAHILENLCTDYTQDPQQQLQAVVDGFKNWYGAHEQKRNPNFFEAMKDWLLGLPSELNIEYEYYTISQTLKQWVENTNVVYKEQKDSQKEAETYYHLVIREFITLCKKHNVEVFN